MSEEEQRELIRHLHQLAGHPVKEEMLKILKKRRIEWNYEVMDEELNLLETSEGRRLTRSSAHHCRGGRTIPWRSEQVAQVSSWELERLTSQEIAANDEPTKERKRKREMFRLNNFQY